MIVRGLGADSIVQGDDALAAILGASSGLPAVPKVEGDASGLPAGAAFAATTVIEYAAVAAVILGVWFVVRLFE